MKRLLLLTVPVMLLCCGCQDLRSSNQMITSSIEKTIDKVIIPAAQKSYQEGTSALRWNGSAQALNPKYKGKFTVLYVTGVIVDTELGLDGVAGQVDLNSDTVPSPVPTSGPVGD